MSLEVEQLRLRVQELTNIVNSIINGARKTTDFTDGLDDTYYLRLTDGSSNSKVTVADFLADYTKNGGYTGSTQDLYDYISSLPRKPIPFGSFEIHQNKANTDAGLEVMTAGDLVYGFINETLYVNPAIYNGGDTTDENNYTIISKIKF